MNFKPTFKAFGSAVILMEWPKMIDETIIFDIISFEKQLSKEVVTVDTIISYHSLTIRYQHDIRDYSSTVNELKKLYVQPRPTEKKSTKVWKIPVCYDIRFGLDLEAMSSQKKIEIEEIIRLHAKPRYLIYFLGFQPGFMYLGGLNRQIHIPRKSTPRLRVEKGSVGIGGKQTGIYPQANAGGWNILGRSPLDFFDRSLKKPCFAQAGDRIQFQPIDIETFFRIEDQVKKGVYTLKSDQL